MPKPIVSVIMNCYNSDRYLQEAIDSAYQQTFTDWEIIFYDNGSTDESAKIAKSYDQRLRYFYNNKTVLLGEARNRAIANARGEYIAFLDCDDTWSCQKLALQVEQFKQSTSRPIGLCYTDAMRIDAQGNNLLSYLHGKKAHSGNAYEALIRECFIACSAAMVKADILREIQGFDSRFHYVEEWDVWLKIAKQYNIAFVEQCQTQIRIHDRNLSKDLAEQYEERMRLAKIVMQRDPNVQATCRYVMRATSLQYQISQFFLIRGAWKKFLQMGYLLAKALSMPFITLSIIKKYCNPSVYRAFKKKYLSEKLI